MRGGGGSWVSSHPIRTAVHITWYGAHINFGDLTPYLTYALEAGAMEAHPGAVEFHHEALQAHRGALHVHPGTIHAHPGAIHAHSGATYMLTLEPCLHALPRALHAHPGAVDAHPGLDTWGITECTVLTLKP
jgi:hypothetical protein